MLSWTFFFFFFFFGGGVAEVVISDLLETVVFRAI